MSNETPQAPNWEAKPCEDRSCWHLVRNGQLVGTIVDEATAKELVELLGNRNRLRLEIFPQWSNT